jgi:hypothetical protein
MFKMNDSENDNESSQYLGQNPMISQRGSGHNDAKRKKFSATASPLHLEKLKL